MASIDSDPLTQLAYDMLMDKLAGYGNRLTDIQKVTLKGVLHSYTCMARGNLKGRLAYPLPTGLGKTTSIITWLTALHQLGMEDTSVVVCASKIEALCEIKRELINAGVPGDEIGLLHSYTFDEKVVEEYLNGTKPLAERHASLPATRDNQNKQILLATHNRIRNGNIKSIDGYSVYKGEQRNLVIWDETLFTSDSFSIPILQVDAGLAWLKKQMKTESRDKAINYLERCGDILHEELESQGNGNSPKSIKMPEITPEQVEIYTEACMENQATVFLRILLEVVGNEFRIVDSKDTGLISFEIVVPHELENIIILDASHHIRKLVEFDDTIQSAVNNDVKLVSNKNVTFNWMDFWSGRNSLDKQFSKDEKDRLLVKEYVHVVNELIPEDQGIIVFTFKARNIDYIKAIKDELKSEGIDPDAQIQTESGLRPRIIFLTWGNETSLNKYSYCSNVIFAGLLHRRNEDLAGAIAGQYDDLLVDIPQGVINQVKLSEIAHCVYQACSRGSSRIFSGIETRPMNVWIHHKDRNLRGLIEKVMPDVQWDSWIPQYLISQTQKQKIADHIIQYLLRQEEELQEEYEDNGTIKIATRIIKQAIKAMMPDLKDTSFTDAVGLAISTLAGRGWEKSGRSVIRISGRAYGF
ncbi:hypothetical protein ACFL6N_02565 [Thermodesulfobacteriota bacterium]